MPAPCGCSEKQLLEKIFEELEIIADADVGENSAAYTDGSGTTASANVSQQIFAANATRHYLIVINNSDTEMWINFAIAAVASQPSIRLVPNGGFYEPNVPPNQTVNIICTSSGKSFTAKQA